MKQILLFIGLLLIYSQLSGQQDKFHRVRMARTGCLQQGIEFSSQAQVDSFPINYPGCSTVLGDLIINSNEIGNLNALIQLHSIIGNLYITNDNPDFTLAGLDSIHFLGGAMFDWINFSSFNGLQNLDTIGGDLEFYVADEITNFEGLGNLKHIGGRFQIEYCHNLTDLSGLEQLNSISGGINLDNNPNLINLDALNNLSHLAGDVVIYSNSGLSGLPYFNGIDIAEITSLNVFRNASLSACSESFICNYLSILPGPVSIYSNASGCSNPSQIADACGFSLGCLPYGHYYITNQADVDNFHINYPGCLDLNGSLNISGNTITNLDGLEGIRTIGGGLGIGTTQQLTSLSGLDSLTSIGGALTVGWWEVNYNLSLKNFSGLGNLKTIGGSFEVIHNDSLQSFEGLSALESTGTLEISGNPRLESLQGLNSLDTVRSILSIGSSALTNLEGLEQVKFVSDLSVVYNNLLISLEGINDLSFQLINVRYNPQLTFCAVNSVCNFLSNSGSVAYFLNNAPGCNSREEVKNACLVGLPEIYGRNNFIIYPNPVRDILFFHNEGPGNDGTVTIFSISGEELLSCRARTTGSYIDVSRLPDGFYLIRFSNDLFTETLHFIKIH